ncbi:DUF4232 domain-containing protein [Streptomyces sp. NPDC017673]|uniref:DUF4232 domain-containing protein n=1 Tax=unclassified Streptomyces TaxID=2593676 RepID=UPI003797910F
MRVTTRLAGGLTLLTAGLALTSCDTGTTAAPDATAPPCRTASLTWTLSLLDGDGADEGGDREKGTDRPDARLTAANKGPGACVFAGYPVLEIHNGKAESIEGTGRGRPASLVLSGGDSVTVDLHYTRRGAKGADDSWCVRQGEASVRAPHDTRDTVVPVTDARGKTTTIDACGETLAMTVPRRTPAGS